MVTPPLSPNEKTTVFYYPCWKIKEDKVLDDAVFKFTDFPTLPLAVEDKDYVSEEDESVENDLSIDEIIEEEDDFEEPEDESSKNETQESDEDN